MGGLLDQKKVLPGIHSYNECFSIWPRKEETISRVIEQEGWARAEHYRLYRGLEFPHVNLCLQLDITHLWANRARAAASPTIALVYVISKAANRVPEFRQRIRGEQVVEHAVIHPQVTVLGENDLFGLATLTYDPCFEAFAPEAAEKIERASANPSLSDFPSTQAEESIRDDLLSISILPWLAFSGFAITRQPKGESIPLMAMGKVQEVGGRYQLPFFINFHHALADGLHVARFIKFLEEEALEFASRLG